MYQIRTTVISAATASLLLGGCASMDTEIEQLRTKLDAEQQVKTELTSTVSSLEDELQKRAGLLEEKEQRIETYESELALARSGSGSLLPPNAKAGECYARVFIPPTYQTMTKRVLHTEASEKIAVTQPRYDWAEDQVLVREASTRLEVVPARYDWVQERVLVREASEKIEVIPAVYRDEQEKILISPAYTTWKKGRGPIERIDEATGEIMCLVEVPAQYKTVVKHVLSRPASTRSVSIPAEYKTVKKRVMAEGPRTVEVEVPAEYKTVRVKRLVTPAQETRNPVAEEYQEVTERKLLSEGQLQWRPILCETNTTPQVVTRLQSALRSAGYNPGAIDGVVGAGTINALTRYQADNDLPKGKLTIGTLRKLGVI